jgi:plastocyanin
MRYSWARLGARLGAGLAAFALATGCGGGNGGGATGLKSAPPGGSTSTSISVVDDAFSPVATTVPVGSAVTWTWNGRLRHNVTFDDGAASLTQGSGTYVRTFATAGTYPYHCTIHGLGMSGTVTVQ